MLSKLRARRRVGARNADVRAAAEVDAADRVDRERHHVIDVPRRDPLEAVADAQDVYALQARPYRGGSYHAVDPGERPAATRIARLL